MLFSIHLPHGLPIADLKTLEGGCQLDNHRLLLGYPSLGGQTYSSRCDETCFSVQIVDSQLNLWDCGLELGNIIQHRSRQ